MNPTAPAPRFCLLFCCASSPLPTSPPNISATSWLSVGAMVPRGAASLRCPPSFATPFPSLVALDDPTAPGARRTLAETLAGGNAGVARIPGKHGQASHFSQIVVKVDDKPGELARLLTDIGEAGVNMEDLRLEHSPGAQIGLAEISVLPEVEERLAGELESRGWKIAGAFA